MNVHDEFRALADTLSGDKFIDAKRRVCVTPYDGAYGVAGYVITIEGSPPHGTFVTTDYGVLYIHMNGLRSHQLGKRQTEVVSRFLSAYT